ncbi:unnamed protein product [Callosobruchus maculatus]|uniref:DNA transposase THAP9 n=1 Tax=Callosobruchus maculatus TaxID=64391 RepID=A0A653D9T6_CALMS|nr:unnamed protein product [Callosobruchus maculatus]
MRDATTSCSAYDTLIFGIPDCGLPGVYNCESHKGTCLLVLFHNVSQPVILSQLQSQGSESSTTATASETEDILLRTVGERILKKDNVIGPKSIFRGKLSLITNSRPLISKRQVKTPRNKIKSLQQSVRRLKKRTNDLQSVIDILRKKALITENAEVAMKASLSGAAGDVVNRLLRGSSKQQYPPALRSFALTLHFYSPKAYSFVRKFFNNSLPHPATISKWYRNIDGFPGWCEEALNALKIKAQDDDRKILCNLVFDEMSIRKQNLEDPDGKQISWSYIDKLVDLQYEEQLHLATKVKMRHLHWTKEKMKVRLATQILSKSVSDALNYLCTDLKHHAFRDAEPTANFIKLFNDLFDIFNSKNRLAKYKYKRPLSQHNKAETYDYLERIRSYILNLKIGNEPVTQCPRKTGFVGFLICIESLKYMYNEYVEEKNYLKYILTYKLSQDHLELFFGAIHSRGGHNNNPSAKQFQAAFKKLIVHSQIRAGDTGNIINLDATSILFCSSSSITRNDDCDDLQNTPESLEYETKIREEMMNSQYLTARSWDLTDYSKDVVGYIAGFVVKQDQANFAT